MWTLFAVMSIGAGIVGLALAVSLCRMARAVDDELEVWWARCEEARGVER